MRKPAALVALALLAAACGGTAGTETGTGSGTGAPVTGGTFSFAISTQL